MLSTVLKPRIRPPSGENFSELRKLTNNLSLNTVCQHAHCPNQSECWSSGTATFMVLGKNCTRGCRFCQINSVAVGDIVDENEPQKLVDASKQMKLKYVVLTMVNRDDLVDQGSRHVANCIRSLKENGFLVEALVGDFRGEENELDVILQSRPDVFSHNIETVRSLQKKVRDARSSYEQSLFVLDYAKKNGKNKIKFTKSSIQLGLGETDEEVIQCMKDLRSVGCDILTIGQYLQPSSWHLPVEEFASLDRFAQLKKEAEKLGFVFVASNPLVRSSYKAGEAFVKSRLKQ